ncbi:MAG: alpha/beta hydrolase [Hydrogenophaga sp.]|uniref:alpha/beta hydrolase n=1 Tax=Hydrogenophaga intermedia TaxID=65786 RepID=UPI0020448C9B|nr:dienelactone hydrolase family protein [Hydrogenophaga intermedia]MCM3564089.1 alpha/beta hydrolase [Hydrogenophaga intermedia]
MHDTELQILEGVSGGPDASPVASVIVLHGLGADGNDFVPVAQALDLAAIGAVRFVFPSAPVRPVTINGGYAMRAWYDIYPPSANPAVPRREDEAGLRASMLQVQGLIEREIARGVPAQRIVLMGFSQGCAMTLLTGLRAPNRLAGLAALSGYLPLPQSTAAERSAANADVPVFMAHGEDDDIVVPERGEAARDVLQALGHAVDWRTYPMGHSVCPEEVADLNRWLLRVLA